MPVPRPKEFGEEVALNAPAIVNRKSLSLVGFGLIAIVGLVLLHSLVDTNNAGFYKLKQAAGTGTLTAITKPGMFFRNFGDVTTYKAADVIYFSKHDNEGGSADDSINVRFNDGATAKVTGNVRIELPSDPQKLIDIHKNFRSYNALIHDTVRQVVSEATILTAALMTAEESYTTKRAEFAQMVDDQVRNGVYLTESDQVKKVDPKTGETTTRTVVSIQRDEKGQPLRKDSPMKEYGIRVTQAIIKDIDYEPTVEQQIQAKQQAIMQVVSAKAQADKAVQDRLTAEEVGKKNVAVAQYEQEVDKEKAVVKAQQKLEVAKLENQAAEQEKEALIKKGEGEGEYRRKVMAGDGALDKKLEAYEAVQKYWADAFANSKNPLVPQVVTASANGGAGSNAATQFMEIMGIKAAKDLGLNLANQRGNEGGAK